MAAPWVRFLDAHDWILPNFCTAMLSAALVLKLRDALAPSGRLVIATAAAQRLR